MPEQAHISSQNERHAHREMNIRVHEAYREKVHIVGKVLLSRLTRRAW